MKNFFLTAALVSLFLTQTSFAANQPVVNTSPQIDSQASACLGQLDEQSKTFFQQQAAERGAFMKANPNSIANHDKHFKGMLALDMARRQGKSTAGLPTPPNEDGTFQSFQQKQLSDKMTFLTKFYQQRQACLAL